MFIKNISSGGKSDSKRGDTEHVSVKLKCLLIVLH